MFGKSAQQQHVEAQIEFKEAIGEMTSYYDQFTSCVNNLKEQSRRLDREIMQCLDEDEEHEARLKCLELSLVNKQFESMSAMQMKLFETLFYLRQSEMITNLSHITSKVKKFMNFTPKNILELSNLECNNKAQKYLDVICKNISVNNPQATALYEKYKERYVAEQQVSAVAGSPVGPNNNSNNNNNKNPAA